MHWTMATLAMSGAPPPLPSRDGRAPANTLPRRSSVNTPNRTPSHAASQRHRRQSEHDFPPPPPRSRNDPLPPVPPSIRTLPGHQNNDLPPPPPRNRQDPLPPPPPGQGFVQNPQVTQQRQFSPRDAHTLPRNARSETNLQNAESSAPRLPPRRNMSMHVAHTSNPNSHLTNGAHVRARRSPDNDGMFGNASSRTRQCRMHELWSISLTYTLFWPWPFTLKWFLKMFIVYSSLEFSII